MDCTGKRITVGSIQPSQPMAAGDRLRERGRGDAPHQALFDARLESPYCDFGVNPMLCDQMLPPLDRRHLIAFQLCRIVHARSRKSVPPAASSPGTG